jgi:hypothetical protein
VEHVPINLDVLDWSRDVSFTGRNPVSDHSRPEHVSNQGIVRAIPREQCRAGRAAPVDFQKVLSLVRRNFNLILQHARRP